jgi:hypothetical protein
MNPKTYYPPSPTLKKNSKFFFLLQNGWDAITIGDTEKDHTQDHTNLRIAGKRLSTRPNVGWKDELHSALSPSCDIPRGLGLPRTFHPSWSHIDGRRAWLQPQNIKQWKGYKSLQTLSLGHDAPISVQNEGHILKTRGRNTLIPEMSLLANQRISCIPRRKDKKWREQGRP